MRTRGLGRRTARALAQRGRLRGTRRREHEGLDRATQGRREAGALEELHAAADREASAARWGAWGPELAASAHAGRIGDETSALEERQGWSVTLGWTFSLGGAGRIEAADAKAEQAALQLRRFRVAPGSRAEETERAYFRLLELVRETAGTENVQLVLGKVGMHPSSHPINAIFMWMSGPEEGLMQVQLKPGTGLRVAPYTETLREAIRERLPEIAASFEPSDLVSRVLSFGSPAPEDLGKRGPFHQLQDQVGASLPFADVVDAHDVGMPESRQDEPLAAEARAPSPPGGRPCACGIVGDGARAISDAS